MSDFGRAGAALEEALSADRNLTVQDLERLAQACKTADDLERLETALAEGATEVPGSMGQTKPNPLFAEVRATRALLTKLTTHFEVGVLTPSQRGRRAAGIRHSRGIPAERSAIITEIPRYDQL